MQPGHWLLQLRLVSAALSEVFHYPTIATAVIHALLALHAQSIATGSAAHMRGLYRGALAYYA